MGAFYGRSRGFLRVGIGLDFIRWHLMGNSDGPCFLCLGLDVSPLLRTHILGPACHNRNPARFL